MSTGCDAVACASLVSLRSHFAYWHSGSLRIFNYLTGAELEANPVVVELMGFFSQPNDVRGALLHFEGYTRRSVLEAVLELMEAQLLLEQGSATWALDQRLQESWKSWLPAGAFHFQTKDAPYAGDDLTVEQIRALMPPTPPPRPAKSIEGAPTLALRAVAAPTDDFFVTLHARRTHRSFAARGVSLEHIGTLLRTTWGVQGYLESEAFGALPYKTSPSGGARHPGEVYLMALRVEGLEPGTYHYQAERHALEKVNDKASAAVASAYCAGQTYAGEAAAVFIMTAVFERTMWKYAHPRAYRVVLLETGHLGQTFCLTATRLGLAPFCTAALKDTLIEGDLGIDGITESVLYVVGVGARAAD